MQFSSVSFFLAVAVVVFGAIDASPSPIRVVTPKPGIDYKIRVVTPNPRIRYAREIDEDVQEEDFEKRLESPLLCEDRIVTSIDEDLENQSEEVEHFIEKRSPERIVINYKPPPANGPRHARSVDDYEK